MQFTEVINPSGMLEEHEKSLSITMIDDDDDDDDEDDDGSHDDDDDDDDPHLFMIIFQTFFFGNRWLPSCFLKYSCAKLLKVS